MVPLELVRRLWFQRQGLSAPRSRTLSSHDFVAHLEHTGGLQIDTINVLDRAHYLTLWSRFGTFDRARLDRWIYQDRVAFEYWAHEASILPMSQLPLSRRRMRGFPPDSWRRKSWWSRFETSAASKRRVLGRLRREGPLESGDFEAHSDDRSTGETMPLRKEDTRSLKLLWHAGRIAISSRKHFRCRYDLADRVYPAGRPASPRAYQDSWLDIGLSGNGIATEGHLQNYLTAPELSAADRRMVLQRGLKTGRALEVTVEGAPGRWYTKPEFLEGLSDLPEPTGMTLLCPFDSLLWQRRRAEDLLGFRYRVEIYVPAAKRQFGYYVLPILDRGRLVGRLDPKLHRDRGVLEVKALHLEPGTRPTRAFRTRLDEVLDDLRQFVGARKIAFPSRLWRAR